MAFMEYVVKHRHTSKVSRVAQVRPPMVTIAMGWVISAPSSRPKAMVTIAKMVVRAVIRMDAGGMAGLDQGILLSTLQPQLVWA